VRELVAVELRGGVCEVQRRGEVDGVQREKAQGGERELARKMGKSIKGRSERGLHLRIG